MYDDMISTFLMHEILLLGKRPIFPHLYLMVSSRTEEIHQRLPHLCFGSSVLVAPPATTNHIVLHIMPYITLSS